MFYLNYTLFYIAIFLGYYLNKIAATIAIENIKNENSAQILLEEMMARQKCTHQLDAYKSTFEQLSLVSNTEGDIVKDSSIFDIRVDILPEKCHFLETPTSCAEATACTKRSGYYHIKLKHLNNDTILVECDVQTDGGTWTVIQRRQDGSLDFYRPWVDYVAGFGEIEGEFFIGLDKLYILTNFDGPQELMILMENENGSEITTVHAKYNSFAIAKECDKYKLIRLGKYSGTAGDSLHYHVGHKFTTKDQDNDADESNCAEKSIGAWWYGSCHLSNLNGHYGDKESGRGINWHSLTGHTVSLKYVQMMIRRRKY